MVLGARTQGRSLQHTRQHDPRPRVYTHPPQTTLSESINSPCPSLSSLSSVSGTFEGDSNGFAEKNFFIKHCSLTMWTTEFSRERNFLCVIPSLGEEEGATDNRLNCAGKRLGVVGADSWHS